MRHVPIGSSHKMALNFQETPKGIVVTGKTYEYREKIKGLRGRWNPDMKAWIIPLGTDLAILHEPLSVTVPPRWLCCEKAVILNYDKQQHICTRHGDPHQSNLFVRGALYTGD